MTALQAVLAPRLEIENLSCEFAGRRVVDDISLQVMSGQVMCLLGPSGCGKSTTLRLIAGVERPRSGGIFVDGALICDATRHVPPEKRNIGLLFQDFSLFPHLTVAGNVGFGLRGTKDQIRARVAEILQKVDLARYIDVYPDSLSGGEQQRVALARALAPRPRIMLMDEPFSGLDNRLRDGIRDDTLALLREEQAAVLLVTHEPEEAMRMADQIALMRHGKIVQQGGPYNVYTRPVDRAAMGFFSDVNVIEAEVHGALAQTPFGQFLAPGYPDGTRVEIAFRPQHVRIDFDRAVPPPPSMTEGTAVRAEVLRSRFLGQESLVEFKAVQAGLDLKLQASVPNVFLPQAGKIMNLRIPRDKCLIFPVG